MFSINKMVIGNINFDNSIKIATKILCNDGIVIFPTSTVYGIACDARKTDLIKEIFLMKGRSFAKPISILVHSFDSIKKLVVFSSIETKKFIKKVWPGKVTFVLNANNVVPKILTANSGNIGIRVPYNFIARTLAKKCGFPITATSANVSNKPAVTSIKKIDLSILKKVDLVMNFGNLSGGIGSTVIDATSNYIKVIRKGSTFEKNFF